MNNDNPEPAAEPASPQKQHMAFVRPQSQNANMPFYTPEHNIALQGARMLGEVELLINDGRFEQWQPIYDALRAMCPGGPNPKADLDNAGMACLEFVADCWGQTYVPGMARMDWPPAPRQLTFDEAVEKLLSKAPKAALSMILMLQGYFMMDFYFMGISQMREVGMTTERAAQDVYSRFDMAAMALWHGALPEQGMREQCRRIIGTALQQGVSPSILHNIIDQEAAKE